MENNEFKEFFYNKLFNIINHNNKIKIDVYQIF